MTSGPGPSCSDPYRVLACRVAFGARRGQLAGRGA